MNGSGCRPGTANVAVAADNTRFVVSYRDYVARAGGPASPIDFRKNCQINLAVHVPQGFTYAIARADYYGFAHLQRNARAMQRANYYFTGTSGTTHVSHTFHGPFHGNWHTTDVNQSASLIFAPCGRHHNFNINSELLVYADNQSAGHVNVMKMDATRGSVNTLYHFAWKRC